MDTNENDIYVMIIGGTIVLLLLLCFIISFLFIYKTRQERYKREVESMKEQYTQDILKTELEMKERTLKNISEEIHDNVGQVLSLAVLNLSAIEMQDAETAEAKIDHVTNLVKKAVSDLRNLSKTMDASNIVQAGLVAIVRFELELLEKTGIYKTNFVLAGNEKRLDSSRETVAYRIVQECLNNMMKHAQACAIDIAMVFRNDALLIEINDNGIGFEPDKINARSLSQSGSGIRNMNNRASMIGAVLMINSVPSQGTKVSLTIPYHFQSIDH